jgi:hypothetical protein
MAGSACIQKKTILEGGSRKFAAKATAQAEAFVSGLSLR